MFVFATKAIADDPEGQIVRAVINSLINMEGTKPRSSAVFVKKLLQKLARFAFY
jgi:serine/threonine-protein kinase 24/25/MST4